MKYTNPFDKADLNASRTAIGRALARRCRLFARDEDGALIIFGIFMFGLMLAIAGLSFDLMRYEANRSVLQATSDRAALAAASLSQSLDPAAVVQDYFAKAGLGDYLDTVIVTETIGSRRVDIEANLYMPLHHGNFGILESGVKKDVMVVNSKSTAMEAIGNVEISMVLDVSGSMGSQNRLNNLKTAAGNFIDVIYDSSEAGAVSTSIIPYSEQVSAGPTLLSYYNRGFGAHTNSYCINFSAADYDSTSLSTSVELEQTLHFDPWTSEYGGWDPDEAIPSPVCRTQASRMILPWSDDRDALKSHVNSFYSGGNTSTDIGLKWGVALLDPTTQPVLDGMITSGDVVADFDGRPEEWTEEMTMKIIVVMSDGENTHQHYMTEPYRTGDSAVYFWENASGDDYFSIWTGEGEPDFDPEPECTRWNSKRGECRRWETPQDWYRVNGNQHSETPYGGENSVRLTWSQLWAKIPVEHFTDRILVDMGASWAERNAVKSAEKYHSGSTKNARMASICSAAKNAGVTIFAVALDTNDAAAGRLESCASSPAHFYRVQGTGIDFAFQSIASQINMLRLVY